ncbi:hypothetical protein [Flavobacterium reichenbachii]|uniref:Uncharacterized protein n=1 Tax=Flavobacterium reichenbachii TaxID=362418 RepID=A0A085ZN43_9FLAO|nr:hypothetical protein [Flavobacterium reichenbachii]KFF05857.1 hypothetical protein IW19_10130 [Flavobacterium reichenbachii]OXB12740.1 hypothetical protein B0A68_18310 [Flavobacterium reichenbachii]
MNKYLKGCLVFIGIIILIILLLIGLFLWSSHTKIKNAEIDGIKYSKECDSVNLVTEQPEISFVYFKRKEIAILKFQILRDGKLIQDTVIKNGFIKRTYDSEDKSINIPYKIFFKTDTIVVTTNNKLQYYISGYHHYAYLHYGMFGYLGSHDCRFNGENCIINNQQSMYGALIREDGWINPEISKHIQKISVSDSIKYYSFAKKCRIKTEDAEHILREKRKNLTLRSTSTYGIEVGPKNSYYIFGEETESGTRPNDLVPRNLKRYVIKINCETGEYNRYKDYPFDDNTIY